MSAANNGTSSAFVCQAASYVCSMHLPGFDSGFAQQQQLRYAMLAALLQTLNLCHYDTDKLNAVG